MPIDPPVGPKPPIGRGWLIDQVAALIDQGDVRLLTLTGLPGVGKTTVTGGALRGRPHRWIAAGTLPQQMPPADDVGVDDLVVVDGVGDDSQRTAVTRLLDRGARIVATARRPLRIAGERVLRVPSLPLPDPDLPTAALAAEPTVLLFRHVAVRSGSTLDWDDVDVRAAAEIARTVGGHPMAIELLAARAPTYSPTTIADQIASDRRSSIVRLANRADELLGTIEWSARQLPETATEVMTAMTVFAGPVPVDAIDHVLNDRVDDLPDILSDLVDAHLIDADHDGGASLYALPPLVGEMLRSRAVDVDDTRRRKRRLEWASRLATEATAGAHGETGLPDSRLTPVESDLTASLHDAIDSGDADAAAALTIALAPVWVARGVADHDVEVARRSLELADGLAPRCATALARGWLANLLAERVIVQSDLAQLITERDRSLRDAQDCEPLVVMRALALAVRPARALDDRSETVDLARRGHELALDLEDQTSIVRFEVWLGMLAHQDDDVTTAVAWGSSALQRARRFSDEPGMLAAAGLLRTVPRKHTRELPVPTLAELADTARRQNDRRTLTWVLPAAAAEALMSGDFDRALDLTDEALQVARRSGGWTWYIGAPLSAVAGVASANAADEITATIYGVLDGQLAVFGSSAPPDVVRSWRAAIHAARTSSNGDVAAAFVRGTMMTFDAAMSYAAASIRSLRAETTADSAPPTSTLGTDLTTREVEVLEQLANGGTNKDIAAALGIRPKTVMHHAASIYRKLHVRGRGEAVAWWFQQRP